MLSTLIEMQKEGLVSRFEAPSSSEQLIEFWVASPKLQQDVCFFF